MPTVEELWRRFGDGIERTARTTIEAHCNALDRPAIPYAIEDAVRAASVQIMMEFADRLQAHPDFADQPAITYWLKRRARIVSQDLVESGDVTPGAASTPMPQAVPASVRIYFRIRALSAAQRARGAELLRQGGQLSGWFAGGAL
ncbi:MAG TPA: hypothetical protein VM618_06365, partial [Acidimicrobiia bacterium]|nr:hypothetical protein [Acidimicrobiia bacterium]